MRGAKFQFGKISVLEMDGSDGRTTVWMYLMPQKHLKMAKRVHFIFIFYHPKCRVLKTTVEYLVWFCRFPGLSWVALDYGLM